MKKRYTFNPASFDAFQQSLPNHLSDRDKIHGFIFWHREGVTSKQIGEWLDKPLHKFSGRIRELVQDGKIQRLKIRRDGAEVLVIADEQARLI